MYKVNIKDESFEVAFDGEQITVNGQPCSWDAQANDAQRYHVIAGDKSYRVLVVDQDPKSKTLTLNINGHELTVNVLDRYDLLLEKLGMDLESDTATNEVRAPMPGLIVELKVQPGDEVESGDALLVLEAMKMENVLKAPGKGKVKSILVEQGASVEKNQILVDFE